MSELPSYRPMLASSRRERFADPGWIHEVKWDGIRCLLRWDGATLRLFSRSGADVTGRYPELAVFSAPRPCILDGEIIAADDAGRPSFGRLQRRMNLTGLAEAAAAATTTPVSLVLFDVLYDGRERIGEPWSRRRERLDGFDLSAPFLRADFVVGDPDPLWRFVEEHGLEGIVSKRAASPYRPGTRSPDWRKVVVSQRLRAVVGGFLPGEGARAGTFASLVLGLLDGDRLRWIGNVGTGFDDAALRAIRAALEEMELGESGIARSRFHPDPDLPRDVVFVAPHLVAVIAFKEWTGAGRLRAPVFVGFADADPASVTWRSEGPTGP